MLARLRRLHARAWLFGFLVGSAAPSQAAASAAADPAAALLRAVAAAETSLREGKPDAAASRYRDALLEGRSLFEEL